MFFFTQRGKGAKTQSFFLGVFAYVFLSASAENCIISNHCPKNISEKKVELNTKVEVSDPLTLLRVDFRMPRYKANVSNKIFL